MSSYQTDTMRWQAVSTRDADADGEFVYAVLTTGIVCYPSCPSRMALPENVRYFADVSQALAAGFRHCKRCRTDLPPLAIRNRLLVVDACRLINEAKDAVRIESIADSVGLSRFHLQKLFKQYIGLSPKAYAQAIRANKVKDKLVAGNTVTQSLLDAGYDSVGSFYSDVQKRLGMKANTLRQGSPDVTIRYAFADTSFGLLVVAMTQLGVCAVLFGDTQAELTSELQGRFQKATLVHEKQDMQKQVDAVVSSISLPAQAIDIPLDIQGTAFQEKVWGALRKIQPGCTASYTEVANAIGQPNAARAVARACAANPVAVLVPCHRVVKADGGLSGYRWGIERKQALLDNEADGSSASC